MKAWRVCVCVCASVSVHHAVLRRGRCGRGYSAGSGKVRDKKRPRQPAGGKSLRWAGWGAPYRDQGVVGGRPGLAAKARLSKKLLCHKGLFQAREKVLIFCGVGQGLCCFLIHLRQRLPPQFHHPERAHTHTDADKHTNTYIDAHKQRTVMTPAEEFFFF